MIKTNCPHCRRHLGDFLYADACPHCQQVLTHNQAKPSPPQRIAKPRSWPVRAFFNLVRLLES